MAGLRLVPRPALFFEETLNSTTNFARFLKHGPLCIFIYFRAQLPDCLQYYV